MSRPETRCADASDQRGEPLYGTASHVKRWLLLEQPGSWGHDALAQSGVPADVAFELRRRAQVAGIRIILIRRGVRFVGEGRQCYFARTEPGDGYLAHMTLNHVTDLLDVDLEPLATGGEVAGAALHPAPVFLVCTHGKRDACCSIRGNQVSRVACGHSHMDAWESAHIGGDRFAANLVCFPHGVYYGRVAPHEAISLMELFTSGSISLDHYRGRSCFPFPVQAAEYFARVEADVRTVDGIFLDRPAVVEPHRVSARFALGDHRRIDVKVAISHGSEGFHLTCGATEPSLIPRYELESCVVIDP